MLQEPLHFFTLQNPFVASFGSRMVLLYLHFITTKKLYSGALVFLSVALTLIIITYVYLYLNKRIFFYKEGIRKQLNTWISLAILNELDSGADIFVIPQKFLRIVKYPIAQQFVIDELVAIKKSLTGEAARNIVQLYNRLNLKQQSVQKLRHRKWYKKAAGLQELYIMDQADMLLKMYRLTNSENEYIRMEAQIGIIHLAGFKGLRFLDIISYPIAGWQQIKLLDQLSQVQFEEMKGIHSWLKSPNSSVVVFALRLAEVYQQFQLHDAVADCLSHASEPVRVQAVRTLTVIASDTTAGALTKAYQTERFTNRLNILDSLCTVATKEQSPFLLQLQQDESDLIKLKAARALAVSNPEGLALLEANTAKDTTESSYKIFRHVQAEINA